MFVEVTLPQLALVFSVVCSLELFFLPILARLLHNIKLVLPDWKKQIYDASLH
jgi:hypothetical protein